MNAQKVCAPSNGAERRSTRKCRTHEEIVKRLQMRIVKAQKQNKHSKHS